MVLALLIACGFTVGSATPVAAAGDETPAGDADPPRTYVVDEPAPSSVTGLGETMAENAFVIPPEYQPNVGETVRVKYQDATVDYAGVTAACTESITANKPIKNGSKAEAYIRFVRSGCSGTKQAHALIQQYAPGWTQVGGTDYTMTGTMSVGLWASYGCSGTSSMQYRGAGTFSATGSGATTGTPATLSCG